MASTIIDPSLYCKIEDHGLIDINIKYVDDLLRVGTNEWKHQANATLS